MLDFPWTTGLELAERRFLASTKRGLGPPRQSEPLQHQKVIALDLGVAPINKNGPLNPKAVHVMSAMFLCREDESGTAERDHITMDNQKNKITWLLIVSKTDTEAKGCSRSWSCICEPAEPYLGCPYHVMREHLAILEDKFGKTKGPDDESPLFPMLMGSLSPLTPCWN